MLTKYYIEIDGIKHEIPQRCVKNWDEVKCAYKRTDYSGVTRSFTSQFEFVNEAYDMLMALYLRDGFNAVAVLSLYTITDRWEWEEQFSAPIDFSSLSWDNYVLKVNCIDNSLAAMIKSRKSTKYEFVVGEDIPVYDRLNYDRIKMSNAVTHGVMGNGDSSNYDDGSVVMVQTSDLKRLPTYVIGDAETYENSPILYGDQDDSSGSYFIKIDKSDSNLNLEIELNYYGKKQPFNSVVTDAEIYLMRFNSSNPDINESYVNLGTIFSVHETEWVGVDRKCVGCFASLEALKKAYPNPEQDVYAIIGKSNKRSDIEAVYFTPVTLNVKTEWVQGAITTTGNRSNPIGICSERRFLSKFDLSNHPVGSMYALVYKCNMQYSHSTSREFHVALKSQIKTTWISRAKAIEIDAMTPEKVLNALADKICDNKINIRPHIDISDSRIAKTYILAAESIRNIPGAKFYSTFQEFCDWMEAVFGYTYYLGEVQKSSYVGMEPFNGTWNLGSSSELINTEECPAQYMAELMFMKGGNVFAVFNTYDGKFYTKWPSGSSYKGWNEYNDPSTGRARTDKIYILDFSGQGYYVGQNAELEEYSDNPDRCAQDIQDIFFVPRNSLFLSDNIIDIRNIRDLSYSINNDFVISTVVAGYEKQEYEAECGRDEWNFSAQYNTGVDLSEKKIELVSKYRADCYGLEFLAQERAKDTTDNNSDNTVFFVHCKTETISDGEEDDTTETNRIVIDRSIPIEGALSDSVFNGEYSPYQCIKSNEGYISAIKKDLLLRFASFDGNTAVKVNGVLGNTDIQLSAQLFTAGEIKVTTGDIDTPIDPTSLYKVESDGITYTGYLLEADVKFSKNEAVEYKLIVKDIEL